MQTLSHSRLSKVLNSVPPSPLSFLGSIHPSRRLWLATWHYVTIGMGPHRSWLSPVAGLDPFLRPGRNLGRRLGCLDGLSSLTLSRATKKKIYRRQIPGCSFSTSHDIRTLLYYFALDASSDLACESTSTLAQLAQSFVRGRPYINKGRTGGDKRRKAEAGTDHI